MSESKRPAGFHERQHAPDPWAELRRDIAPVWATPDPKRIDRLRWIVDELDAYDWAADFQNMLKDGRFMELIEALLHGLCAYSKERREGYEKGLASTADLREIIKNLSRLDPTEKRRAAIEELKWELDMAMSGAAGFAEWHPLLSTAWPKANWEEWRGRYPDDAKNNLLCALVMVLLVAGYDSALRTSHWKDRARNKKTAQQLAQRMAEQYGFAWEHPRAGRKK